jgi:D-beta-D-heptose 7-phosphate kinase/D-beta-D-heptose 1-phosphate adenosyltransferase
MTTVFTNGCFDLLHAGHVRLLQWAATFGELTVGLNSDESVRRLKGPRRPLNSCTDRLMMLRSLRCVSRVEVFHEDTPLQLIQCLRPDILVKGPDYRNAQIAGQDVVWSYGGQVLVPDWPVSISTSFLIRRIQGLAKPTRIT